MNIIETIPKNIALPLFKEYLLDLINNNYSQRTLANYYRDLEVFESYLHYKQIKFARIDKLLMSGYKEFLRSGEYLKHLKSLRNENTVRRKSYSARDNEESRLNASRRDSMYTGRLSSQSVNRMLSAIRSYLRFLLDADVKVPLAPDAIKLVKTEKKEKQVADLDELISLIEAPDTYEKKKRVRLRNRAIMELLFSTGMRISELINLNREDLKLVRGEDNIGDPKIYVLGKGKKQRFVYLTPRCQKHLENYLHIRDDKYPALFIPYRGLRSGTKDPYVVRLSTNYLQSKIKEYRKLLGIVVPTSAHSFRHGFATYLAENGANPAAIQRLLGHESLQTTSRYVHSSDKFAEKSHKEHHPLSK